MPTSAAYYDYTRQEHVLSRFRLLCQSKFNLSRSNRKLRLFRERSTLLSMSLFFFLPLNLLTFGWNCETCLSWYRIQNYLSFRHIEILLCDVNENVATYVDACERVPHVYAFSSSPEHITMRFASARYTYRLCGAFRTIERRTIFDVSVSDRDE